MNTTRAMIRTIRATAPSAPSSVPDHCDDDQTVPRGKTQRLVSLGRDSGYEWHLECR
jgi:hypothetical protein